MANFSSFKKYRKFIFQDQSVSGFTLLELLVSMIVAGLVVSGLLYLVVELAQMNRRESLLTQTQQDMQRALGYIADDVREAVYIYSDPSALSTQLNLPPGTTAVLAFWRPVPVKPQNCNPFNSVATAGKYDQCQVLNIRQSAYSLVVYVQKNRDGSDVIWEGASRIIRYELDKYTSPLSNLDITPGYQDPTTSGVGFATWKKEGTTNTVGNSNVLVDFVDSLAATTPYSPDFCKTKIGPNYTLVPSTASTSTSFYGCVRGSTVAGEEDSGGNQDVYLFLRGNALNGGTRGAINSFSEDSSLPTLETRVLMRGVINKNPN